MELYPYIDAPDDAAREAREFLTELMRDGPADDDRSG